MSDVNNSPCSSATSSSKNTGDTLFEPSVEMMVDDFDDERTLEEEEALAAAEADDPEVELSNLQKEGEMPIEELLALYNCSAPLMIPSSKSKFKSRTNTSEFDEPAEGALDQINDIESDDQDDDDSPSKLRKLYPETYTLNHRGDQRMLRTSLSRPPSEDEDDGDYSLDEDDYKKTIMVGSEFQAVIPEGLCRYDDALPYENDDKLLWDPTKVNEQQIEDYLVKYISKSPGAAQNVSSNQPNTNSNSYIVNLTPPGENHLKDDEQALYLLLQCGHNIEEALRRRRINSPMSQTSSDGMSLWSEDECRNFENGLRTFGKDFHSIQKFNVRTRLVGELMQFYYLWKKTERHDVFANKERLEKKKYNLHPGVTDYMDRFLEEQEGGSGNSNMTTNQVTSSSSSVSSNERNQIRGIGVDINSGNTYRERSSSPGINSFLYSDAKHNSSHSIHRMRNNNSSSSSINENINSNISIQTSNVSSSVGGPVDSHGIDNSINRNSIYNSENNTNILNSGGKTTLLNLSNTKINDSNITENIKFL